MVPTVNTVLFTPTRTLKPMCLEVPDDLYAPVKLELSYIRISQVELDSLICSHCFGAKCSSNLQ